LISQLQAIGGHAQAVLGYDDTDEFRSWYKQNTGQTLNDYVVIHDQSWGNWNPISADKWPSHLWGAKPEGAWVVTGRDFMRLVSQWWDCYAFIDMGGFPNGGPVSEWQARVNWTVSASTTVTRQELTWYVDGLQKAKQTMTNPLQNSTTSDTANVQLSSGQTLKLSLTAVDSNNNSSVPVLWEGVVPANGDGPEPPSNLQCSFVKRTGCTP
jgi:hypothetical protein